VIRSHLSATHCRDTACLLRSSLLGDFESNRTYREVLLSDPLVSAVRLLSPTSRVEISGVTWKNEEEIQDLL
jgi:hypothetical protein